jgi:hypothetical protein
MWRLSDQMIGLLSWALTTVLREHDQKRYIEVRMRSTTPFDKYGLKGGANAGAQRRASGEEATASQSSRSRFNCDQSGARLQSIGFVAHG